MQMSVTTSSQCSPLLLFILPNVLRYFSLQLLVFSYRSLKPHFWFLVALPGPLKNHSQTPDRLDLQNMCERDIRRGL